MTRRSGKLPSVILTIALSTIGSTQNPPPTSPPAAATPQTPAPATPAEPARPAFEQAWEQSFEAKTPAFVTASPELVFVAGPATPVVARRASDGTEAWQAAAGSEIEPALGDGVLIVQSGGRLRALELTAGAVRWEVVNAAVPFDGEWIGLGGFGALSGAALPLPIDARITATWTSGTVIVAAGRQLRALRAADGSEAWRTTLPAPALGRAVADDGRVFVAQTDRTLVALDLASGTVVWRQPGLAATPGPLAAAAGHVYFGASNGVCYAYRQRDGRREWFYLKRVPAIGVPAADDRHVYFMLETNELMALDRETGNERWDERERISARLSNGIKAANGMLFLTLGDGAALMLQAATGAVTAIRAAPPPAQRGIRVESFDVAPDGAQVYLLSETSLYTLSAHRRK